MHNILLVEDDQSLREVLTSLLESQGYNVFAFGSAELARNELLERRYDCVLADFKLPGMNGIEFLRETRSILKAEPFLLMTAFGSIDIAVEAMKEGANDFIQKPFEPELVLRVLSDLIKHKRIINRGSKSATQGEKRFLTRNKNMEHILQQADKVARVDTPVLLLGESGTGKEVVARFIHEHSKRADQPFVAINCAAIPDELLESELFGHEEGAFTGATQRRIGVLEYANGGSIFMDEIGDMPPHLQVKLLRFLQEGEIKRVGGNKTIKVAPRIIAATNINLEQALAERKMREDFYYRIAVITLTIPPLRERPEDVQLLAQHYVEYFSNLAGKAQLHLSRETERFLKLYQWPGNVRELENVMERASILAMDEILPSHLGIQLQSAADLLQESTTSLQEIAAFAVRNAEIEAISRVLAQTAGNKSKAAELLGVSYKTLLNKVKEYELQLP